MYCKSYLGGKSVLRRFVSGCVFWKEKRGKGGGKEKGKGKGREKERKKKRAGGGGVSKGPKHFFYRVLGYFSERGYENTISHRC
jgi:hypothetical protein